MKRIFLIAGIVAVGFSSCSKKPEIGGTEMEKMANEWWVQLYHQDGTLAVPATYHGHIATYNSAANGGEIWIDDQAEIWDFKIKAKADVANMTFSANKAVSVVPGYNIWVTVTEGKILENVGKSKSGVVTDSIYMKVVFEDDPTGETYTIRGHARTRFSEDDYH